MFDEYSIATGRSYSTSNVKAEDAKESLVDTYILHDNDVNGHVFIFKEVLSQTFVINVRFRINGKGYKFEERVSSYDKNAFEAKEYLAKCMTNAIFTNIVKGLVHRPDIGADTWISQ